MLPEFPEFWIDVNLPPAMKNWIAEDFQFSARTFTEMGFQEEDDSIIFNIASHKKQIIIITTKDTDYIYLSKDKGIPPKILHINTGNISKAELKKLFYASFKDAVEIFLNTKQLVVELVAQNK